MLCSFFKEELKTVGFSPNDLRKDEKYLNVFSSLYILVDKALRSKNRYRIIKALTDEGLKIQHYGRVQN